LTTNKDIYLEKFLDIKHNLIKKKFSFLYTDGPKNNEVIGLAVTTEEEIIKKAVLPSHSSVFLKMEILLRALRMFSPLPSSNRFSWRPRKIC